MAAIIFNLMVHNTDFRAIRGDVPRIDLFYASTWHDICLGNYAL